MAEDDSATAADNPEVEMEDCQIDVAAVDGG